MRLTNCASPHSDIVYVQGSINSSVLEALDDLGMVWGINESDPELLPPNPESIKAQKRSLGDSQTALLAIHLFPRVAL